MTNKIQIMEIEAPGQIVKTIVLEEIGENEFRSYSKEQWDELEAQREQSGTL